MVPTTQQAQGGGGYFIAEYTHKIMFGSNNTFLMTL